MIAVAGNYAYLCGMRKLLCPQCKIAALYVVNDRKERLLVYVLENGEVVPKDPAASTDGFDLTANDGLETAITNYNHLE